MKNILIVDVDTEREQPILISKGEGVERPKDAAEASKMILEDISCLFEAMLTLVHIADQNEYTKKADIVNQMKLGLDGFLTPIEKNNEKKD